MIYVVLSKSNIFANVIRSISVTEKKLSVSLTQGKIYTRNVK